MQTQPEQTVETAAEHTESCPLPGEHHQVYCPTCSARLTSRRCKLICDQCGYYMSCADYY